MMTQKRLQSDDDAPFYANYVTQVPDGDFVEPLGTQMREMRILLEPLTEKQAVRRLAKGLRLDLSSLQPPK